MRTSCLVECCASALRRPDILLRIPYWLLQGRARLEHELATRTRFDPATLPYNEDVLDLLRMERAAGSRIVLATGASEVLAGKIAAHVGLFDDVVASPPARTLKGDDRARALAQRFGERGFIYVGGDRSHRQLWRIAGAAVFIGRSGRSESRIKRIAPLEKTISAPRIDVRTVLKQVRAHQWVKNLLVFTPILTSGAITRPGVFGNALLAFCGMSLVASAIYVINDIFDIGDDRLHPTKRNRPIASGRIGIGTGLAISAVCLIAGLALSAASGAIAVVLLYALVSLAYSSGIKTFPVIDIFFLAGLYTLRIIAGGVATGIGVSLWLLAFSGFLFLALAIVKRLAEVHRVRSLNGAGPIRGYSASDEPILIAIGIASTFASAVVLALYLESDDVLAVYSNPWALWALVPLVTFWQCRLWVATGRGFMHEDPIVYASRDWVSYCVGVAVLAVVILAHYEITL